MKFNKWVFRSVVFALIVLFVISLFVVGFENKVYANCPKENFVCDNPFYHNCDFKGDDPSIVFAKYVCNQTTLLGGTTIGEPPSKFMKNIYLIVAGIIILGFCANGLVNLWRGIDEEFKK